MRLDFALHAFVRLCWVSDGARELWSPRFSRILRAWVDVEIASVLDGQRPCALVTASARKSSELLAELPESVEAIPIAPGSDIQVTPAWNGGVIIGSRADAEALLDARRRGSTDDVGALLGYPACCREAFRSRCAAGMTDHTWPMAAHTLRAATPDREARDLVLTNVLWRAIGIRAIPHLPCRYTCEPSIAMGLAFAEVASRTGHAAEATWTRHILSWPVAWSALHGIAEIKSPVLKLITNTDATAAKAVVSWHGDEYPEAGATGVAFPYRANVARQAALTRAAAETPRVIRLVPM
jgi:hypothetical protein